MKVFICALIALCLLAGGVTYFCIQLDTLCDSLLQKADTLEAELLKEDKENSQNQLSQMRKEWEKSTSLLMAFIEHGEVNNVTDRLECIKNSLLYNDFATAYRELSSFKHHVSCIASGTKPSITNIL